MTRKKYYRSGDLLKVVFGWVWFGYLPAPPPFPSVNNSDKQTNKLAQNTEKEKYDIA
jgi:hypothetical protein